MKAQPMSVADKVAIEETLHGIVVDLLTVRDKVRVAFGAQAAARVQRLIANTQAMLVDVENRAPDTSQREVPEL